MNKRNDSDAFVQMVQRLKNDVMIILTDLDTKVASEINTQTGECHRRIDILNKKFDSLHEMMGKFHETLIALLEKNQ